MTTLDTPHPPPIEPTDLVDRLRAMPA